MSKRVAQSIGAWLISINAHHQSTGYPDKSNLAEQIMVPLEMRDDNLSENHFVADKLDDVARLLDQQNASLFRVRAYRDAASYLRGLPHSVRLDYQHGGKRGLDDLPTIGPSIAATIAEILHTGALGLLDRLRGAADPEQVFQSVPMIGPALARLIHDDLGIDTLEALEAAAYDGRLATIKGIGPRRAESLRHSLSDILARRRPMSPTVTESTRTGSERFNSSGSRTYPHRVVAGTSLVVLGQTVLAISIRHAQKSKQETGGAAALLTPATSKPTQWVTDLASRG